jgi:hypothetical protein
VNDRKRNSAQVDGRLAGRPFFAFRAVQPLVRHHGQMIPDLAVITTLRQFQYALGLVPAELRFASVHGDEKLFVLC